MSDDRDKLNRIEELKTKLFSKSYEVKIEHRDSFTNTKNKNVREVWDDQAPNDLKISNPQDNFFMKTSLFKKFFIFSLIFFVFTLGYATYMFFDGGNTVSNSNIDISVLGNNFTAGGDELSLVVGVTNKNSSSIDLADLIIEYPKSSNTGDASSYLGMERSRISLGTIPAGAVRNENVKLVLFGQQGTKRSIKISLEYRVEGSNAIFIKDKSYDVTISSTPLDLTVDAPETISPNQDITLNVKTTLNATKPAKNVLVKVDYPVGFQFISSVPGPTLGNNIWNLGDLAPGADHGISIVGKMIDVVDGEEKSFNVSSGTQSGTDKSSIDVVFNSLSHIVTIKKPFIDAKIFVNGVYQKDYAIDAKTAIHGEIEWMNNLDTKVNDLEIHAKILGNAVNKKTINAQQGFYDSGANVITWDKNYQSAFAEVSPGDSGSVGFSVSPLSLFSADGGILIDPTINIEVSIAGKQSVIGYAPLDLQNSATSTIKIISDLGFLNKGLYYSGAFVNKGPIPPKVQTQTTYTVVWSLSNTSNKISKATIHSSIPQWIKFVGTISPTTEDLVYNPSTKEIVWNVGNVPKGAGITGQARTVSFQVALTPSFSQVRTTPVIINDAVLTAHDDFANVDIKVNKPALYTTLSSDPAFPAGGGVVVE